jgi:hypothetical protein
LSIALAQIGNQEKSELLREQLPKIKFVYNDNAISQEFMADLSKYRNGEEPSTRFKILKKTLTVRPE